MAYKKEKNNSSQPVTCLFACCFGILITLTCNISIGITEPLDGKAPQRIVSLGPINTENVYLLGAGDRLLGTTVYCVRPEAAKATTKIGSVLQVSIEKIIALRPDLVLATGFTQASQIKLLRKAKLKVVIFKRPSSFAESCNQFIELGKLLHLEEKAKTITAQLQQQVISITKEISELGVPAQKVLFQVGANPLYVSGKGLFINDFIELSLAENAMGNVPQGRIGYEQVIAANPDVILIGMMGSETGIAAEEKKKWSLVKVIKAAKNNRIYVISPDLVCSPSPATFVQALRTIALLIYPELNNKKKQ